MAAMNCFLIYPAEIGESLQSLTKIFKHPEEKKGCAKLLFHIKMAQPA